MAKADYFETLLAEKAEIESNISVLTPLADQPGVQGILDAAQVKLSDIESELSQHSQELTVHNMSVLLESETGKAFRKSLVSACRKNSVDFNVRCIIDYVFSTGDTVADLRVGRIRSSKSSEEVRNDTPLPTVLKVNLTDNRGVLVDAKRENEIPAGTPFGTAENAFRAVLGCYTVNGKKLTEAYDVYSVDFQKRTGKVSRFESASAREKLSRLTESAVKLSAFFETMAKGKEGTATEQAAIALQDKADADADAKADAKK